MIYFSDGKKRIGLLSVQVDEAGWGYVTGCPISVKIVCAGRCSMAENPEEAIFVCVCVCVCVCVNARVSVLCSCKIVIMYVRFFPNLLCNMYVTLCMPMVPAWGFWKEFLWVVLS